MKIVVGSKHCTKCHQLKDELESKGKTFKYIDITALSNDKLKELVSKYGMSLPIVYEE